MTRRVAVLIGCGLAVLLAAGCAMRRLERQLDPASREFLSKVRYLVTGEERRTFLNLPPAEREGFIVDFWKKRDPTPETEENEFRDEYFKRIEDANHLFTEGEPGWLQDRGRIYILLGPPTERETYPRGMNLWGLPTEIWYYGFFPIVFVDYYWNGNYRLDPLSANQLAEIMSTQLRLKPQVLPAKDQLEAEVEAVARPDGVLIRATVPYRKVWLKAEDGRLKTTLTLAVDVETEEGRKVWQGSRDLDLDFAEEDLPELLKQDLTLELEATLGPGAYVVTARVENRTDEARVFKRLIIRR